MLATVAGTALMKYAFEKADEPISRASDVDFYDPWSRQLTFDKPECLPSLPDLDSEREWARREAVE